MKVYIACHRFYHEGATILGVFFSLESAVARCRHFVSSEEPDYKWEETEKMNGDTVFKMENEEGDWLFIRHVEVKP